MIEIFKERHLSYKQDYVEMWEGDNDIMFTGIDTYSDEVKIIFLVAKQEEGEKYPGFLAKKMEGKKYDDNIKVKSYVIRTTIASRFVIKYKVMGEDGIMIFYRGKLVFVYNWRNRNDIESILTKMVNTCARTWELNELITSDRYTFRDKFEKIDD